MVEWTEVFLKDTAKRINSQIEGSIPLEVEDVYSMMEVRAVAPS
jgi:hypothetical protein